MQEQLRTEVQPIPNIEAVLQELKKARIVADTVNTHITNGDYSHYTTRMNGVVGKVNDLLNTRKYAEAQQVLGDFLMDALGLIDVVGALREKKAMEDARIAMAQELQDAAEKATKITE